MKKERVTDYYNPKQTDYAQIVKAYNRLWTRNKIMSDAESRYIEIKRCRHKEFKSDKDTTP